MRLTNVLVSGLVAASLFFVDSVGKVQGQPTPYSVRDTGYWFAVLPSTIRPIFWLDNQRILYKAYAREEIDATKKDSKFVPKEGIYILDLRSNQSTRYGDAEGFLCYRDGYIRYLAGISPKSRTAVWREGKIGEEKDIIVESDARPKGHRVNPLTCNDYDARGNATERGKRLPLLDTHGVLEYARVGPIAGSPMYPARLFPGDGKEPITLPLSGAAVSEARVRFYEFANVYTVGYLPPQGRSTQWPKNAVHHVFLMSPNGDVTDIPISGGAWSDAPVHRLVLSRAGIVLYGGKLRKYLDPGTTGLYLVQGNRTVKLASGLLNGIGVSPNGCTVAAAMQTYTKTPDPTTIRIIDLCSKEGGK